MKIFEVPIKLANNQNIIQLYGSEHVFWDENISIRFCTFEAHCLQEFKKSLIPDREKLFETVKGFLK